MEKPDQSDSDSANRPASDATPPPADHPAEVTVDASSRDAAPHPWLADCLLLATAVMWGANILVFKNATYDLNPWAFNAARLSLTAITLSLLAGIEYRRRIEKPRSIPWLRIIIYACLNGLCYLILFVRGIDWTTAGNTALILASMPMWTAAISFLFTGERLPRITWLGLSVTFVGTIIVTTQSSGQVSLASKYFLGNLFMLGAALAWASGTVLSRSILNSLSPLQLAATSALLTTPVHFMIAWPQLPEMWQQLEDPATLAAVIYSGIFSTGIAYVTWNAGVQAVGGSHASVYQNVVTLVAVVGGWIVLGEQPVLAQFFGGALTILGLYWMRRGRYR